MTTQLPAGTMIVGRYRIIDELGHGGNASVHLAHDQRLDTEVALKVLWPQLAGDQTFIERFRREAQTLAKLSHPNILRLFELGEDEDLHAYFLVLEYLTGGTLKDRLGPSPWSVADSVEVLRPVAEALDYAHDRRPPVVHRDMKPSNILFSAEGRPVVSDFGVARLFQNESMEKSLTGDFVIGTPAYMSPEQVKGRAEPASDRYALAVIAYELLAGRVPHQATTLLDTLVMVSSVPPPPPRQFNPAISEPVEQVLLKGLAREPADRHATAQEFVQALAAAGQLDVGDATMIGTRTWSPAPTIGTPRPQPRPSPVRRHTLSGEAGSTPTPAEAPDLTVAAARSAPVSPFDATAMTNRPNAAATIAAPRGPVGSVAGEPSRSRMPLLIGAGAASLLIAAIGIFMVIGRGGGTSSDVLAQRPLPTVATPDNAAAGVLFSDALDSLANGKLPRASTDPANYVVAYGSDGYVIQKLNPNVAQVISLPVPVGGTAGSIDNTALAVDVRITDPAPNRLIALTCRDQAGAQSGYRLSVKPALGQIVLSRLDAAAPTPLKGPLDVPGLYRDAQPNHLELICAGSTISARVNGTEVASADDGAYRDGGLLIGAGADSGGPLTVEAHFKNLLVTKP